MGKASLRYFRQPTFIPQQQQHTAIVIPGNKNRPTVTSRTKQRNVVVQSVEHGLRG